MFFALSKLLAFLLKPLNWAIAAGLLAVFSRKASRQKRAARWSIGLLLFFSNPLIVNWVIEKIERDLRPQTALAQPFDVGILLGGTLSPSVDPPLGIQQFGQRANRMTETVALFHSGKIRRILLSGGDGRLFGQREPEAKVLREYLLRAGVPDSCIWVEARSRNTHENAVFSKNLLDEKARPEASLLLITSAMHLRRAVGCFQKIGLDVQGYPADFQGEPSSWDTHWLLPSADALDKWESIFKEWIGGCVYRLKGFA